MKKVAPIEHSYTILGLKRTYFFFLIYNFQSLNSLIKCMTKVIMRSFAEKVQGGRI